MNKTNNSKKRADYIEIIKYVIGGIICIIIIACIVISKKNESEKSPWWTGIDRLSVSRCKNTYCTDSDNATSKVLYSGLFSPDSEDSQTRAMLKDGLNALNMEALAAWTLENNDYNIEEIKGVYRFELLSEDQKSSTELWGYCTNTKEKRECIVFDNRKKQYRIRP